MAPDEGARRPSCRVLVHGRTDALAASVRDMKKPVGQPLPRTAMVPESSNRADVCFLFSARWTGRSRRASSTRRDDSYTFGRRAQPRFGGGPALGDSATADSGDSGDAPTAKRPVPPGCKAAAIANRRELHGAARPAMRQNFRSRHRLDAGARAVGPERSIDGRGINCGMAPRATR
jgi:hypothetical protein